MSNTSANISGPAAPSAATAATAQTAPVPPARPRLDSIDLLRGLAMILMALDHVRDFLTDVRFYPLDLSQTTLAMGLTRWITHFSAPVFVFLAGTGAYLSLTRGKSKGQVSLFLLTRGIWLIVLELTIVRFGWLFNVDYSFTFGQVIWAIGWSMIALSLLSSLPAGITALLGIVMIATHNMFDTVQPAAFGDLDWVWRVLHVPGGFEFGDGYRFAVTYPLIPWIGVMAAGYGFGALLKMETKQRRRTLLFLGLMLTAGFIVLRYLNVYGDPHPWRMQESIAFTVLDFVNCTKYPASLLFLLMTLGPSIAVLPLFERWKGKVADFVVTFGRVPLFFYLLHIYLIHAIAVLAGALAGQPTEMLFSNTTSRAWPGGYGFSLPVIYAVWVGVVLALYPLCRWFAGVRRRSKNPLFSYL